MNRLGVGCGSISPTGRTGHEKGCQFGVLGDVKPVDKGDPADRFVSPGRGSSVGFSV